MSGVFDAVYSINGAATDEEIISNVIFLHEL
jgi:hypothetical protein